MRKRKQEEVKMNDNQNYQNQQRQQIISYKKMFLTLRTTVRILLYSCFTFLQNVYFNQYI